ncbi:MAG: hypothetical protein EDM74_05870 [Armatimonadetes bacterium]|nr:MAG: hypothetical protein EDM74_05870 [Armatimonadota bacterium]
MTRGGKQGLSSARAMFAYLRSKGFFALLTGNFLGQFLSFTALLVVAKTLSKAELGDARLLQSIGWLGGALAMFGANTAVLKYCSENRGADEREGIFAYALRRLALTSLLTLGLIFLLREVEWLTASPGVRQWVLAYAFSIPLLALADLTLYFLQSQKRVHRGARMLAWVRAQSFVLIVALTLVFGFRGFVWGVLAGSFLALVPLGRELVSGWRARPLRLPGFDRLTWVTLWANAASVAMMYADLFILDRFNADRSEIGLYSLGALFALAAGQVSSTAMTIATPYFSERAGDLEWLRPTLFRHQLKLALGSVALAALTVALAWGLIEAVYGPSYRPTLLYTGILLGRFIAVSSVSLIGAALLSNGLHKFNAWATTAGLAAAIALGVLGFLQGGFWGVALGQVGAGVVYAGVVLAGGRLLLSGRGSLPKG